MCMGLTDIRDASSLGACGRRNCPNPNKNADIGSIVVPTEVKGTAQLEIEELEYSGSEASTPLVENKGW